MNIRRNTYALGALIVALFLWSVWYVYSCETAEVTLGEKQILVEVVRKADDQRKGLSSRPSITYRVPFRTYEGMLFAFEEEGDYGFWMKDMHFSIDIIWLDSARRVTHIAQGVSPDTYPQVFRSPEPSRYVLEIDAFATDRHGIKVGDVLKWEYQ